MVVGDSFLELLISLVCSICVIGVSLIIIGDGICEAFVKHQVSSIIVSK